MRPESVFVVLNREYLQRVKNKGFWIATLIVPLFAAAVTTLPGLLIAKSRTSQQLVVVDDSGLGVAAALKAEATAKKAKPATDEKGPQRRGFDRGDDRLA